MGILDKLKKPFSKNKEKIQTPKTILDDDIPEDLLKLKQENYREQSTESQDDSFLGMPAEHSIKEQPRRPPKRGYIPPEFGLSTSLEKHIPPEDDNRIRNKLDMSHKFELILSKLETIDARLRLIEDRLKIRKF